MSDEIEYRQTALGFDWDEADGQAVTAVMGRVELGMVGFTAIALVLDRAAVTITVDDTYDQVDVAHGPFRPPADEIWGPAQGLADLVGRPLSWCWETRNQQGYLDGFMLAFGTDVDDGALVPRVLFMAEGAALSIYRLSEQ